MHAIDLFFQNLGGFETVIDFGLPQFMCVKEPENGSLESLLHGSPQSEEGSLDRDTSTVTSA
jgi:hypothetical protein